MKENMISSVWMKLKRHHRDGVTGNHGCEPVEKKYRPNRSVNEFESKEDLKMALLSNDVKGAVCDSEMKRFLSLKDTAHCDIEPLLKEDKSMQQVLDRNYKLDWVLENYNPKTTHQQSLESELRRLLVLKSYLVLDTQRRQAFDQITEEASKFFDCPMAMISLVDMGRQWFLSKQGLEAEETPRKVAFCAHVIQSSLDCFVVPNATKDVRFQHNPLVLGPPNVRFYAGAPLVSPEGEKLGTLCVVHNQPRPDGLTQEKQNHLKYLAAKAVHALVDHRKMKSNWFNNLIKTSFPEMDTPPLSDEESEDDSENTPETYDSCLSCHSVGELPRDEKAASLMELVYSLEKKAREDHLSKEYLQPFLGQTDGDTSQHKKKKTVRFAEDEDGQVRTKVHTVESWKEWKHILWWSSEDMYELRKDASRVVTFYTRHRPTYVKSLVMVVRGSQPREVEELILKKMSMCYSSARGLESMIVPLLKHTRKSSRIAVMRAQSECRQDDKTVEETMGYLRDESLVYSQMLTCFAKHIGDWDHIKCLSLDASS